MKLIMNENLKKIKKINFLSELEKNEIVSQNVISKKIFVSLGMVNALLKKAISKGFVKSKSAPYKRYIYYLTKQGFTEKSKLVREYLEDSLSFFNKTKLLYTEMFQKIKNKKIYIVGEGDLVDVCRLSSIEAGVTIKGHLIIKNKKLVTVSGEFEKHNNNFVYVIVESKLPQDVYNNLKKIVPYNSIFHPKILHISDFEAE